MKRLILTLVFTLCTFQFAQAANAAESIKDFRVEASLDADRRLEVTETIKYDFGDAQKRGIFRLIPERYSRNGANFDLHFEIGPSLQDGGPAVQQVTREGEFRKIRIGEEDVFITGSHVYTFAYATNRAINDFPEENERELYWNVTGNGWPVSIGNASFSIALPAAPTKTVCFTGVYGSTETDCRMETNGSRVTVTATRMLGPGEGLTLAIRLPEGSMRDISSSERLQRFIQDNMWVFTPLVVFIIMFAIWWNHGRDPKGRGTIIAEYEEPEAMPPGMQIALLEQHVPSKAISATLLDLARRGYAKVRFDGDPSAGGWFKPKAKIFYEKVKEPIGLAPFERTIFDAVFSEGESVDLSERHESFWQDLQKARKQMFEDLKSQGLFGMDPNVTRALWTILAVACVVVSFFLISLFGELFIISGLLSGGIIMLFGWQMPRTTRAGAILVERILGFRKFLSVTEKARLEFTDAPEKKPEEFARFLPAAVAFGVEEKWAGQFANIQLPKPSYVDGTISNWSAVNYAHAMESFHSASASSMYTAPSSAGSGGSGFSGGGSGGGFGGGGGGSW